MANSRRYRFIFVGIRYSLTNQGNTDKAKHDFIWVGKLMGLSAYNSYKVDVNETDDQYGLLNEVINKKQLAVALQAQSVIWKARLSYLCYTLFFTSVLFYIVRLGIKKVKIRTATERGRKEAVHIHELDLMKTELSANISLELRTQLLQIFAPVAHMMNEQDNHIEQSELRLVYQNSMRLLNRIDQQLDFGKVEVQKSPLDLKDGDVIKFIHQCCQVFISIAEKQHITFTVKNNLESCLALFDHDKIDSILLSLLSNALKFTPPGGQITVELNMLETSNSGMVLFELRVLDTGIGMLAEKQASIFEKGLPKGVSVPSLHQHEGVNLFIARDVVSIMGGVITVESEEGKGSCFEVRLPLKLAMVPDNQRHDQQKVLTTETAEFGRPKKKDRKTTILIVEDNYDFRAYLKEYLSQCYNIIEAATGKEGWQKTIALHPNLILSDINMPETDGIDFCKKIRSDKRTEHIPFILITGLTAEEQELISLETGANDFITKPFNFDVLHLKIRNLLQHQRSVKETYQQQIELKPSELDIESPDAKFMKKVAAVIESNISNTAFSVEMLSSAVNMNRVTLYKKIFHLSGKTPIQLIKDLRMNRAVQLLEMKQFTIAEITYQVGYNDPRYFAKSFKAAFSVFPSQYLSANIKDDYVTT